MTDRIIDTGINANTNIVANRLNYDYDMAILQQGSLRSIRRFFERLEHPELFADEDRDGRIDIEQNMRKKKESPYSINSVAFVVQFVILILFFAMVWDFLKT
jgi:hypothetical protein